MSSSNTIPQGLPSETEKQLPLNTETGESQILSVVPPKVNSSPSKLSAQEELSAMNKIRSSILSELKGDSPSLPSRWMMLLEKFKNMLQASKVKKIKLLPILEYPHSKLSIPAQPVNFNETNKKQREEMVQQLHASLMNQQFGQKLGIAANQIGLNKRVMLVMGRIMFNPQWHPTRAPKNQIVEGCYSVPGKVFSIARDDYGWASWFNLDGIPQKLKLKGLESIVFQHELDHLNGICCADIGEEVAERST